MTSSLIFEGEVQVYLYGQNALIPVYLGDHLLASIIGVEGSGLEIKDHRFETFRAMNTTLPNGYPEGFLRAFNQPAWAEIYYDPEKHGLEIDLYETSARIDVPMLWMGILENNLMPSYEVEWEIFKPVDENNTAFCALVKTQPVAATS